MNRQPAAEINWVHVVAQRHEDRNPLATNVLKGLFSEQLKIATDKSKYKSMDCGRRGGKTVVDGRLLMQSAQLNPAKGEDESIIPYIAPTKNQAKRLMWGRLKVLAEQQQIPMEFKGTDLIAIHKNGAQIWIMGADDDRDIERLRGFSYRRVIVDEAQSVGADFEDLIDVVLDPALADYNGDLILSGTPGAACTGYFYDACNGLKKGWKNYSWNILNNPMFPLWRGKDDWRELAKTWLHTYRQNKGWNEDHPTYQREWLGRWVRDEGGLVYKYNPSRDNYASLPGNGEYDWKYVLGVDLGYDDSFAVVVFAFTEDLPDIYEVDSYKVKGKTISDWAKIIRDREEIYGPVAEVADTGALGKAIVKELNQRFGTALKPAEKKDKIGNIGLLNADLIAGRIHVKADSPLAKEWTILQWDEQRKKEDDRFANDCSDAGLYAYREARHWLYEPKEIIPEVGTREYSNWEMDKHLEDELRAFDNRESQEWWEH